MPDPFRHRRENIVRLRTHPTACPNGEIRRFFLPATLCIVMLIWVQGRKRLVLDGFASSHGRPRRTSKRGDEGRGFCGLLTDNAVHGQPRKGFCPFLWTVTLRPSIPMGMNVRSPVFIPNENRAGLRLDILRLRHAQYRACSLAGSKTVFQTRPSILGRPPGDVGGRMGDSGQILLKMEAAAEPNEASNFLVPICFSL